MGFFSALASVDKRAGTHRTIYPKSLLYPDAKLQERRGETTEIMIPEKVTRGRSPNSLTWRSRPLSSIVHCSLRLCLSAWADGFSMNTLQPPPPPPTISAFSSIREGSSISQGSRAIQKIPVISLTPPAPSTKLTYNNF